MKLLVCKFWTIRMLVIVSTSRLLTSATAAQQDSGRSLVYEMYTTNSSPVNLEPFPEFIPNKLRLKYIKFLDGMWHNDSHSIGYGRKWDFQRNPAAELYVVISDDDQSVMVSDRDLYDAEALPVADVWKDFDGRRTRISYLRLRCLQAETDIDNRKCYCPKFPLKPHHVVVASRYTDKSSNSTRKSQSSSLYGNDTMTRRNECNGETRPKLSPTTFSKLTGVRVIDLSGALLTDAIDPEVFAPLGSVELLYIENSIVSSTFIAARPFCSFGRALMAVHFSNIRSLVALNSSDDVSILNLIDCQTNEPDMPTEKLRLRILHAIGCNVSRLTAETFSGLRRNWLTFLNLSNNAIESIDEDAFKHVVALLSLDLSYNRLTVLSNTTTTHLRNLIYLNVARNNLHTVTDDAIGNNPDILFLYLGFNRIRRIGSMVAGRKKLLLFHANDNRIERLEAYAFAQCDSLMLMSFSNNNIDKIDEFALANVSLPSLVMDLSFNKLSSADRFQQAIHHVHVQQFISIDLAGNNLSVIPQRLFSSSTKNHSHYGINLAGNRITDIHLEAFTSLTGLQVIVLRNNLLVQLHEDVFKSLESLRSIYLDNNHLESLPSGIFRYCEKLIRLSVRNNRLQKLPENMTLAANLSTLDLGQNLLTAVPHFDATLYTKVIFLDGNNISEIFTDAFVQFPTVKSIFLNSSGIVLIHHDAFSSNRALTALDLSNNPLLIINPRETYFGFFSSNGKDAPLSSYQRGAGAFGLKLMNLSNTGITSRDNPLSGELLFIQTLILDNNQLGYLPPQSQPSWSAYRYRVNTTVLPTAKMLLSMVNCSLYGFSADFLQYVPGELTVDFTRNLLTEFPPLNLPENATYVVRLDDNPVKCSCRMRWLNNGRYSMHYQVNKCQNQLSDRYVPLASVPVEDFLCRLPDCQFDALHDCACYTDNSDEITRPAILNCSDRHLSRFPQLMPNSTERADLSKNSITRLEQVQSQVYEIKELNLAHNQVNEIQPGALTRFRKLVSLNIAHNRLTSIGSTTFTGLKDLKFLFLDNNFLSSIESGFLADLQQLQILTLHSNTLDGLDVDLQSTVHNLPSLTYLTLNNNPWNCTELCDNATFKNWLLSNSRVISNLNDVRCQQINDSLAAVVNIPDEYFRCHTNRLLPVVEQLHDADVSSLPLSLILGAIACSVLTIVVLVAVYRRRRRPSAE